MPDTDREILVRLDERVAWLVKNGEVIQDHTVRIGGLERFRSYSLGIVAGLSSIVGLIFALLKTKVL